MDADIGRIGPPRIGLLVEIFHIRKLPACQEVVFDVVERPLHLAMSLFFAWRKDDDLEAVLIGECLKGRIEPDL